MRIFQFFQKTVFSSLFLLFSLFFQTARGNSRYIFELKERLEQSLADGTIAYSQYRYILDELEDEPDCDEITNLLQKVQVKEEIYRYLKEEYCVSKKRKPVKSSKNKRYKDFAFKNQLLNRVYPRKPTSSGIYYQGKWTAGYVGTSLDYASSEKKIKKRNVSFNSSYFTLNTGNITRHKKIGFVVGRSFWSGQQSISDQVGLVYSGRNLPNGLSARFRKKNLSLFSYGSVTQNKHQMDTMLVYSGGGNVKYSSRSYETSLQSNLTYFDGSKDNAQNLVNGLLIKEKIWEIWELGVGHSWYNDLALSAPGLSWEDFYGEIGFCLVKRTLFGKIFQAMPNWTNPLMAYSSRFTDTTGMGMEAPGRGEGGFQLNSEVPLVEDNVGVGFRAVGKVTTDIHWHMREADKKYRRLGFQISASRGRAELLNSFNSITTDSSMYYAFYHRFSLKINGLSGGIIYNHKSGVYRGSYPHMLEIYSAWQIKNYRIKISAYTRDIVLFDKYTNVMLLQAWQLAPSLKLDMGVKLPFYYGKISDTMYYQLKINSSF
ncbi:MAG: hypothetical protein HQK83_00700 [Fibrobacteria bacterium]|nr:hypothetical protein [Fibrobacteria bacterium]